MGRQDNSNATSGLAPVADAVATGGPSSATHRAQGRRDALVPFCIVIVSAAFSMMLFEQFGLSLPASVVAGAVAWTAFMLLHKQVQKSAQIAHLKAELARTRTG